MELSLQLQITFLFLPHFSSLMLSDRHRIWTEGQILPRMIISSHGGCSPRWVGSGVSWLLATLHTWKGTYHITSTWRGSGKLAEAEAPKGRPKQYTQTGPRSQNTSCLSCQNTPASGQRVGTLGFCCTRMLQGSYAFVSTHRSLPSSDAWVSCVLVSTQSDPFPPLHKSSKQQNF